MSERRTGVDRRAGGDTVPPDAAGAPQVAWPPVTYWARIALIVISIVVLLQAIAVLRNVILVILASFVFAIGLQPAANWLERRGWSRGVGVALVLLGFGIPLLGLMLVLIPVVVGQLGSFVAEIPDKIDELAETSSLFAEIDRRVDIQATVTSLNQAAEQSLPTLLRSSVGFVFNLVTVLVLTPYFAVSMPGLKSWIVRLFPRPTRADMLYVLSESSTLVSNYIAGNLIISVIAFVVSLVGLWLIGLPYVVALAAWIALTDLIPVVGAALGAALAMLVAAFVGGPEFIVTTMFLILYQQIENYVIAPRIMRRAVNVTPPMVIIALMIGGSLAGFVGALLALPVAAMLKVIVTEFVIRPRIEKVQEMNPSNEAASKEANRPELGRRPLP